MANIQENARKYGVLVALLGLLNAAQVTAQEPELEAERVSLEEACECEEKSFSTALQTAPAAPLATSQNDDFWQRVRNGFGVPDPEDPAVDRFVQWHASRPRAVAAALERARPFLYLLVEEAEKRLLPTELAVALPVVESAFHPKAMSHAKAGGVFQFIPETGRRYGLPKSSMVGDSRFQVVEAGKAAYQYLSDLFGMFGSWELALSAYNCGEGCVQRAIVRSGGVANYSKVRHLLPAETRRYVPAILAVARIIRDPQTYGVSLPAIENAPALVAVRIGRDMDVAKAADLAGLTVQEFRQYNPAAKLLIATAAHPVIYLPEAAAGRLVEKLERSQGERLANWTLQRVGHTEDLASVARRRRISLSELKAINDIGPKQSVKQGSTLVVPRYRADEENLPIQTIENAVLVRLDPVAVRQLVKKARLGETASQLARRLGVPLARLVQWNPRIKRSGPLPKGATVIILQKQTARRAAPKRGV